MHWNLINVYYSIDRALALVTGEKIEKSALSKDERLQQ